MFQYIDIPISHYSNNSIALGQIQTCRFDVIWWHLLSSDIIWCHLMSSYVILCHLMSSYVIWCHLILSDVIWCHLLSYYVIIPSLKLLGAYTYLWPWRVLEGSSPLKSHLKHKLSNNDLLTHVILGESSFCIFILTFKPKLLGGIFFKTFLLVLDTWTVVAMGKDWLIPITVICSLANC